VNPQVITSNDVLEQLQGLFDEIEKQDIDIVIKGEKEKTQKMASELSLAFIVSLFLIFIVLLINFNSFKMVFIIISVIPFSILGALVGHFIMGINLTFPSLIGILGLAGVVINDGIVMLDFLKHVKNMEEFYERVKLRVRPILITSLTTLIGLSTLIFYPSGQGVFLQPLAISLGFGLLWGTILNLLYLPVIFVLLHKLKKERS
jgi:multidrug efflux pump subunit AcrB